jgi:DNA invertase Pin-like site-specific DNA recombinase
MKAAIWARVSTTDQHAENQLEVLRTWAASRGLEVAAEFATEDSAWQGAKPGNGKGAEFDRQRKELINGARLGRYDVVLLWAIDRLSRKGIEDTLATMRQLYGHGADLWSHQEGWLQTSEPHMRELLVSFMAWMAQQESQRRSERIKAGLARRKAEGKQVGGRKPGSKDRKPRTTDGYAQAWEEGGARRAAQERRAS